MFLGKGQAEDAEPGDVGNDLHRHIGVGQVPGLRVRHDLGLGEAAHLAAHRLQHLVEAGVADRAGSGLPHQLDEAGAVLRRVARRGEVADGPRQERSHIVLAKSQIGGAHELGLAHGDAVRHLRQVLAGADRQHQTPGLAQPAFGGQAVCVGGGLADRLGIGGEPGEAVGGVLAGLQCLRRDPAAIEHLRAHAVAGAGEQAARGIGRGVERFEEIVRRGGSGGEGHREGPGHCAVPKGYPLGSAAQRDFGQVGGVRRPARVASATPATVTPMPAIWTKVSVSPNIAQATRAVTGGTR